MHTAQKITQQWWKNLVSENSETEVSQETATTEADSSQSEVTTTTEVDTSQQEQKADEADASSEGDEGKQDEPVKYEFKHPEEGAEFNPAVTSKFAELASKHKLSQEAAQEILGDMAQTLNAVQAESLKSLRTQWQSEVQSDKDIGGEKLQESLAVAKKAIEHFTGNDETLRALLNESGLGDHPGVIKMFYRVGKEISEDTFVGAGQRSGEINPAKQMYPNLN